MDLDSIVVGITQSPISSLDPLELPWNSAAYLAVWNLYDPLLRVDGDGIIQNGLAESWEIEVDTRTLILNLRKGVRFHNGTLFNADSVIITLQRYQKLDNVSQIIKDVKAKDNSVVIHYDLHDYQDQINVLLNLLVQIPIVIEDESDDSPIGTGPFTLVAWDGNSRLTLQPNANYWMDESVAPGQITFQYYAETTTREQAILSKELDAIWRLDSTETSTLQNKIMGLVLITDTTSSFTSSAQEATTYLGEQLNKASLENTFSVCAIVRTFDTHQLCSQRVEEPVNEQYIYREIFSQYQEHIAQIYGLDQVERWATEGFGTISNIDSTINVLMQNVPSELADKPEWNDFINNLEVVSASSFGQISGFEQEFSYWSQTPETFFIQPGVNEKGLAMETFVGQNFGEISGLKGYLTDFKSFAPAY